MCGVLKYSNYHQYCYIQLIRYFNAIIQHSTIILINVNDLSLLIIIWHSYIIILEWTKLVCTPASTALFASPGRTDCVQVRYRHIRQAAIPARVVLGTASRFVRCTCASLPYLQNRLPSLIISAILAQYSSLCDHLVLQ